MHSRLATSTTVCYAISYVGLGSQRVLPSAVLLFGMQCVLCIITQLGMSKKFYYICLLAVILVLLAVAVLVNICNPCCIWGGGTHRAIIV